MQHVRTSTNSHVQAATVRQFTKKAKASLTKNDFKSAVKEYTSTLIYLGLEHHPATELKNVTPSPSPPLFISTKKITQLYLGRSAAWFGAEQYWRSYEDASHAVSLEPANRWAVLRTGYCLLRMNFFQAAVDVFRRGLIVHTGDKKLKEGFQRALNGLRVSWLKYLPNLNGVNIGLTSTSTLSSTLPMPQDVVSGDTSSHGNEEKETKDQETQNTSVSLSPGLPSWGSLATAAPTRGTLAATAEELAEAAADAAAVAADQKLEECEERYIEQLTGFGMILDCLDLVHQEARWWSFEGSDWRDQIAASRDIQQSMAKVTKVLLRYKVPLTALYLFYMTPPSDEEELSVVEKVKRQQNQVHVQQALQSIDVVSSPSATLPFLEDESATPVSVAPSVWPTPPSNPRTSSSLTNSPSISPRRAKQLKQAFTETVPLPTKMYHGLSQDMTTNQIIAFICECKLIDNDQKEMDAVYSMLAKFQLDRGIIDPFEDNRKRAIVAAREEGGDGGKDGEGHQESDYDDHDDPDDPKDERRPSQPTATSETTTKPSPGHNNIATSSEQNNQNQYLLPTTLLFPKFCESIVRLVLKRYPSGKIIVTENEQARRKKELEGLSLIATKKKELQHKKLDRPPNISERLSRGLDSMLAVIGPRLVGSSITHYRWIPLQERTYVQSMLKPMLPELRGIYLYLRKTSRCINRIGIIDYLKFFVQMDFIDNTRFTMEHAAKCWSSVTYFVGNVHLDLADFDLFVEVLVCCADVLTKSELVTMDKRVRNFMKELLSKYERKCLRCR